MVLSVPSCMRCCQLILERIAARPVAEHLTEIVRILEDTAGRYVTLTFSAKP